MVKGQIDETNERATTPSRAELFKVLDPSQKRDLTRQNDNANECNLTAMTATLHRNGRMAQRRRINGVVTWRSRLKIAGCLDNSEMGWAQGEPGHSHEPWALKGKCSDMV